MSLLALLLLPAALALVGAPLLIVGTVAPPLAHTAVAVALHLL